MLVCDLLLSTRQCATRSKVESVWERACSVGTTVYQSALGGPGKCLMESDTDAPLGAQLEVESGTEKGRVRAGHALDQGQIRAKITSIAF